MALASTAGELSTELWLCLHAQICIGKGIWQVGLLATQQGIAAIALPAGAIWQVRTEVANEVASVLTSIAVATAIRSAKPTRACSIVLIRYA